MIHKTRFISAVGGVCLVATALWLAPPSAPMASGQMAGLRAADSPPPVIPTIPLNTTTPSSSLAALRARLGAAPSPETSMQVLMEIAQTDPSLAIDLAQATGQTDAEKAMWVTDLARQWATSDPTQAWSWLQRQTATRIRDLATGTLPETIVGAIAKAQPQLLVTQLDALLAAGESSLGISPVVAIHLGVDALTASGQLTLARSTVERWAQDRTQPAIGEAAFVSVASALAQGDATRGGAWLKNLPPSPARDIALVEFPAQLAQLHSPRAALDWSEAQLTADLRSQALQRTFSDWVESAPADAGDWLGSHLARNPANAESDRLISTLVNLGPSVKASPATALKWTALVSDPAARIALEERIALRWVRQDRDAAVNYIANHPILPTARKQALLQQALSPQHLASDG